MLAATALLVLQGFPAFAEEDKSPRLTPDPYITDLVQEDTPISPDKLIEASIYLSGANQREQRKAEQRFRSLISKSRSELGSISDPYKKGEALLTFLHDTLFRRYVEEQTKVHVLLEGGVHNCVSSAIVYTVIGEELGLEINTVHTSDHAFCSVALPEGPVDVETTSRYGFDPGRKMEFEDEFSGKTGFRYVPPSNYRKRTTTDKRGLLSFLLQNRISLLERKGKYDKAVPLAVDRYHLLQTEEAKSDLAKSFGNYSAMLNLEKNYSAGLDFLSRVYDRYGQIENLPELVEAFINNKMIFLAEPLSLQSLEKARRFLDDQKQRPYARGADISGLYTYIYARRAQLIAEEGEGYLEAVKYLESLPAEVLEEKRIQRQIRVYRKNAVVDIHNRFAGLFNSGHIDQARDVLERGMRLFPDNPTLQRDRKLLDRNS
ncbi:MAG: hypothetical protein K9L68_03155 [Spirochaetales bacterium]|nr:hypothetical protein [Spirochaetales bacterium]MCF7937575.1 hypothetical protein [Spirochaetales bacterium]